jgi:hypothetical protein
MRKICLAVVLSLAPLVPSQAASFSSLAAAVISQASQPSSQPQAVVPDVAPEAPASTMLHFHVAMMGYQEIDETGNFCIDPSRCDTDGFGVADLWIDSATNTISWTFLVSNITTELTGAHIHQGAAGTNGPIVVDFEAERTGELTGENLFDADLAAVVKNPHGYYVNLHNNTYPLGAIRGQLCDPLPNPIPLPAAVWLLGSGLLGLAGVARRKG